MRTWGVSRLGPSSWTICGAKVGGAEAAPLPIVLRCVCVCICVNVNVSVSVCVCV